MNALGTTVFITVPKLKWLRHPRRLEDKRNGSPYPHRLRDTEMAAEASQRLRGTFGLHRCRCMPGALMVPRWPHQNWSTHEGTSSRRPEGGVTDLPPHAKLRETAQHASVDGNGEDAHAPAASGSPRTGKACRVPEIALPQVPWGQKLVLGGAHLAYQCTLRGSCLPALKAQRPGFPTRVSVEVLRL